MLRRIKNVFHALTLESSTVFVAFIGIIVGWPAIINPEELAPTSIRETFPEWAIVAWGVSLLVGGLVTILGIVWQSRLAMRIEQIGMACLACGTFLYVTALASYSTDLWKSLVALTPYVFFTLVCIARYWNLNRLASVYNYADSLVYQGYLDSAHVESQATEIQTKLDRLEKNLLPEKESE